MDTMRLLTAQRIAESDGHLRKPTLTWERFSDPLKAQYLANADAAATVILDLLIDEAPEGATIHTSEGYFADLDDWLSCRRPAGLDYRGFEEEISV
jgi:hypothetical protein